jgi:hypothetical protein
MIVFVMDRGYAGAVYLLEFIDHVAGALTVV